MTPKQTAVEYLIKVFQNAYGDKVVDLVSVQIEQAKQMEKEQIIESNLVGQEIAAIYATTGKSPQTAKQYYKETYGK